MVLTVGSFCIGIAGQTCRVLKGAILFCASYSLRQHFQLGHYFVNVLWVVS